MTEFLVLSLLASIFAPHAFCMNPLTWKPPPPEHVQFGECFFVPKITGATLSTDYSYRYICRQTFEEGAYQPHEHERYWFIVGSLANAETNPQQLPSNNYVPIKQLLVQFVFLKDTTAKLAIRSTVTEFQITFQSLQQRRTFYEIIYRNVILTKAAPNNIIGVLHEVLVSEDGQIGGNKKLGNNLEALCEGVNDIWHITLRTKDGEPVLIFSEFDAAITCMKTRVFNKLQLLLKAHGTYYILTFPNVTEAQQFSEALLRYLAELPIRNLDTDMKNRLKFNCITMDS